MGIFNKKVEDPQPVEVKDKPLRCPICSNTLFWSRQAQLNTQMASFFNLDWINKSATCFICSNCTHISWFLGGQSHGDL